MVSMDPITTANDIGDDAPEKGISVSHYMNTGVYCALNTAHCAHTKRFIAMAVTSSTSHTASESRPANLQL